MSSTKLTREKKALDGSGRSGVAPQEDEDAALKDGATFNS
jgi:hypothetical protein